MAVSRPGAQNEMKQNNRVQGAIEWTALSSRLAPILGYRG